MKPEDQVQAEIQIEGPKLYCQLMRNNSGACIDDTGRAVRFGLGNVSKQHNERIKSSDLIGITTIVITQEMVGKAVGVFTAVEVKKEGWLPAARDKRETAQRAFIQWVIARGGFGGFADSVDNFKRIIGR